MQWNGTTSVSVIESGTRWWHLAVETSDLSTSLDALSASSEVIGSGMLESFAVSEDEHRFFASNEVQALSPAVYFISPTSGYHESNELIGSFESGEVCSY